LVPAISFLDRRRQLAERWSRTPVHFSEWKPTPRRLAPVRAFSIDLSQARFARSTIAGTRDDCWATSKTIRSRRDDAAMRGTMIHATVEAYLSGTPLTDPLTEDEPDCAIVVEAFRAAAFTFARSLSRVETAHDHITPATREARLKPGAHGIVGRANQPGDHEPALRIQRGVLAGSPTEVRSMPAVSVCPISWGESFLG
jgi:hypothetical protein